MTKSNSAAEPSSSSGGIVIGVDGSEGSRHALDWLVTRQDFFAAPIVPVAAFSVPATADGISPLGSLEPPEKYRAQAEATLTNTVNVVEPSILQSAKMILEGHPGSVLVDAAKNHALLVVGCRGRSALAETLLGSVGSYCVKHSRVPVVIVPQGVPSAEATSALIVGVDGSPNSQAALQWALEHAGSGTAVTAVGVFTLTPYSRISSEPSSDLLERECRQMVQRCLSRVHGEAEKSAKEARVEIHEGVAHLLLGSVATSLTHHSTVATVVVPSV